MSAIFLMLAGELILFFIAYRIAGKDILAPSVIATLFFIFSTCGIIYNQTYWAVTYTGRTAVIVISTLFVMILAEFFAARTTKGLKRELSFFRPKNVKQVYIRVPLLLNLSIVVLLGVMTAYYVMKVFQSGTRLGAVGLSAIGVTKYSEEGMDTLSSIAFRAVNIFFFIYSYITVNNRLACNTKLKQEWLNITPLLFGFLIMFFSGSRKLLVQYPMSLVFMYVIRKRDQKGRKKGFDRRMIRNSVLVCMAILALFYGMREISKRNTVLADRTVVDYLTYYISSPLYLLDRYLQDPSLVNQASHYFGEHTFLGFYRSLASWGMIDFQETNNRFLLVSSASNMAGNEFTWIQRPYQDFGFGGMLAFTFIIYFIYNKIYFRNIICAKASRRRERTIVIYAYFYFVVVLSFYCTYTITEFSLQSIFYTIVIAIIYNFLVSRKVWITEQ